MSKSVTLRTSDAATGRKKKTKISSNAGARKNHAAVFDSPGILRRLVLIASPPFVLPVCGCSADTDASRECCSHRHREWPEPGPPFSFHEPPARRPRTPLSQSAPTQEPAELERRGRAAHGTRVRICC